jgi:tetratricopeptide (TPR) repeat protein
MPARSSSRKEILMSSVHSILSRLARTAAPMQGRVALAALVVACLFSSEAFAQKNYKYETDPVRLGTNALNIGAFAQAKAHFDEAIANEYRVADAHFGIGEIYFLEARYDEAEQEFTLATQGPEPVAAGYAGIGLIALRKEDKARAQEQFDKALSIDDDLWHAQYGLALLALDRGDAAAAEKLLDEGEKKKGVEEGEHLYHRGMALLGIAQNKLDDAETHALKAIDLAPSNPDIVVTLGDVYEKKGVRALAIQKYEELLANPAFVGNKAQLYFRLGVLYEQEQRYQDAVKNFQSSVEADSMLAEPYLHVGAIFAAAKQWDAAVKAYRQYTQIQPQDAEGHRRLADAALRTKNAGLDSLAYGSARKAIELDPASELNKFTLARATARAPGQADVAIGLYETLPAEKFEALDYLALGNLQLALPANEWNLDKAREHFDAALVADSSFVEAYSRLGIVDLLQQDYLSAEENFTIAIQHNPNTVQDRINLGQAKMQAQTPEKFQEAAALFQRAHELAPQSADPLALLGQTQTFLNDYDTAMATFTQALAIDPKHAAACGGRGFLYLRAEQFAEAERDLKCATEGRADSDRYWAMLGQAYHNQGKILEARSAYDRALAINPNNDLAKQGKVALAGAAGQ